MKAGKIELRTKSSSSDFLVLKSGHSWNLRYSNRGSLSSLGRGRGQKTWTLVIRKNLQSLVLSVIFRHQWITGSKPELVLLYMIRRSRASHVYIYDKTKPASRLLYGLESEVEFKLLIFHRTIWIRKESLFFASLFFLSSKEPFHGGLKQSQSPFQDRSNPPYSFPCLMSSILYNRQTT